MSTAAFAVVVAADSSLSDCFVEDASIAAVFMQLQAEELGLGSCWIQVRNRCAADGTPAEDIVRDTLSIPENLTVECIITVGHKDEEANAAVDTGLVPKSLQAASLSRVSLFSTTTNCHGRLLFELGARSAACRIRRTWSASTGVSE